VEGQAQIGHGRRQRKMKIPILTTINAEKRHCGKCSHEGPDHSTLVDFFCDLFDKPLEWDNDFIGNLRCRKCLNAEKRTKELMQGGDVE